MTWCRLWQAIILIWVDSTLLVLCKKLKKIPFNAWEGLAAKLDCMQEKAIEVKFMKTSTDNFQSICLAMFSMYAIPASNCF